jgi:CRP-like cAMP-binding protein
MATAARSFLEGLDDEARELLMSVAAPVSFTAGSTLVRHGEPARGAYVLRQGSAEANVTLPGGETLTVARLGSGDVFGEMSLVEQGTCTATVRASAPVDGWFVAGEDFRALVLRRQPAATRLQHALTLTLAHKLAALNAQLQDCTAPEDRPAREMQPGVDPLAGVPRLRVAPFDVAGFLPRLAFFERFSDNEIDELVSLASYVEVERGRAVFAAQGPAASAFVVVRGAVEIVTVQGTCERRVAVLGPGQLVGYLAVMRQSAHASFAFARESALLLDIPATAFNALYFGEGRASTLLRSAVQKSLLAAMARTNRALTRLLSQAKLEAAGREGRKLEAALHGQLTAAS